MAVGHELLRARQRYMLEATDQSLGAPAASAARRMVSTESKVQRAAAGWGATTIALRALTAIRHLKNAVEVGLVEGTRAATTPMGQAISYRRRTASCRITPTVRT